MQQLLGRQRVYVQEKININTRQHSRVRSIFVRHARTQSRYTKTRTVASVVRRRLFVSHQSLPRQKRLTYFSIEVI